MRIRILPLERLLHWGWYFRGRRPVYVLGHGHQHHHHHPCWTVHTAHGLGIVPRSPLDRKGQPPANAKYGTFVLAQEKNAVLARFDPTPVSMNEHWRTGVPRSLAKDRTLMASVPKVPAPLIQGRMISMVNSSTDIAKAIQAASRPENVIHYDYQTRNFLVPRGSVFASSVGRSGGGSVVVAHMGSHGVSGGGGPRTVAAVRAAEATRVAHLAVALAGVVEVVMPEVAHQLAVGVEVAVTTNVR
jgi:hypothetical protein